MISESKGRRGQVRGYLFEVVILKLLERNDFRKITSPINGKVRINESNIEVKGRGTWHQIDCPCVYSKSIPFIYDIRLLSEVKYYSEEIQKDKIRQYIGVIKDISENYFINEEHTLENQKMYTDIGAYFSANGFQLEAEKLAFVHGIKTISYKNNKLVNELKENILLLEENYLKASECLSPKKRVKFTEQISNILDNPTDGELLQVFENDFKPEDGYRNVMNLLSEYLGGIKSSFFGITETNYYIHFVGKQPFPSELFRNTDLGICQVYYEEGNSYYYIHFSGDSEGDRKFYFTAPTGMMEVIFKRPERVLEEKERHFNSVSVCISLEGVQRNLELKIDSQWLNELAEQNGR